jgi:hypothetical protein
MITSRLSRLRDDDERRKTVLVFRGTGLNAWHYYPFLKNFTLGDLQQFHWIYGVSGGAATLWFYVLSQLELFDDTVAMDCDRILRATMNRNGFARRFGRFITGRVVYDAHDIYAYLSSLIDRNVSCMTFGDCPLTNFSVVGHDSLADRLVIIDARTHGSWPILETLACTGAKWSSRSRFPSALSPRVHLSDFDYARPPIRAEFREYLARQHANDPVIQLNVIKNGRAGNSELVKVSADRFPKLSQCWDFGSLLFGIPNGRYYAAYRREIAL